MALYRGYIIPEDRVCYLHELYTFLYLFTGSPPEGLYICVYIYIYTCMHIQIYTHKSIEQE